MAAQEMLATISDRFKATANVNVVYGEPQVVGDRTVIPVACVAYGFGAGGGRGGPAGQEGEGGGGGGGIAVKPLGVIEITPGGTRFVPVVDVGRLAMLGLAGFCIAAWTFRRYLHYLERRRR